MRGRTAAIGRSASHRHLVIRYLVLSALTALLAVQIAAGIFTIARLSGEARPSTGVLGPEGSIWNLTRVREGGGYLVRGVEAGSPGWRAGLRSGDLIVSVGGVRLEEHPQAYFRSVIWGGPGDTVDLVWLRDGREHSGSVTLSRRARAQGAPGGPRATAQVGVGSSPWMRYGSYLLPPILMLLVGAVIGFLRLRDKLAYQVALLLLVLAQSLSIFMERTPTLGMWPLWALAGTLAVSRLAIYPLALLVVQVLAVFPNPSRAGTWLLRRRWLLIPYAVLAVESVIEGVRRIYGTSYLPARFVTTLDRLVPWQYLWLALLALAALLLLAQRAETRRQSRAKLGVVQVGLVGTVAGGFWALFLWNSAGFWRVVAAPQGLVVSGVFSAVAVFFPVLLLCCLPLSLGYAVFARRVFGIRLIVRRGIRYLLLSRGVLMVEGLLLFVILGEAIRYSQREVSSSIPAVTAIAGVASLLVVVALVRLNRPLMRGIDRRFFRESYDARRLLLDLSQQMLTLREREEILHQAANVLLDTLHPSRVGFFLLDRTAGEIRLVWPAAPTDRAVQDSGGASRDMTVDVVRRGLDALDEGQHCWEVPVDEPARAESEKPPAPVELLVALRGSTGLLGCVALGAKLSEEPYGREDRELLATVATQMGFALENADLLEIAKREAQQSRELSIARRVQQDLFPKQLPEPEGWEFAAVCRPARAVGGDYYEIFAPDPEYVVLALGDVSGKGLGPSLVMSAVHAIIRSRLRHSAADLAELATELNEHLLASSSTEMFMTLFVGILSAKSGALRYVNAGHNPPLLVNEAGAEVSRLEEGGTIIGMFPGAPYVQGEATVEPGSLLVLYSDGVTEALDRVGEMYGEEPLIEEIRSGSTRGAAEVLARVLDSVDRFSDGAEQADDLSLVVARRTRVVEAS